MGTIRYIANVLNQKGAPAIFEDTIANRPAAGYTGRIFISTDTFVIQRDNGTTWDSLGGGGSVTGTGVIGQVTFWGGTSAITGDNALFWDNTNKRLGLGTTTPGVRLDVHGATNTLLQLNGTGVTSSIIAFQQAGSTKYTIGNDGSTGDFLLSNGTATLNPRFGIVFTSTSVGWSTWDYSNLNSTAYMQGRVGGTSAPGTFLGVNIANNVAFAGWPTDVLNNAFVIGINLANPDLVFSTANTERIRIKNTGIVNVANRLNVFGATDNANYELQVQGNTYTGGISPNASTFSTNTTMLRTGCTYVCTATLTLTLPIVSGLNNIYYVVANTGATVTVQRNGTDTIVDKTGTSVTSVTVAAGTRSMFILGGGTITYQIF